MKNKTIKLNSRQYNNHISHLTFDKIFTFNNLWQAYKDCLKTNNWKKKSQLFIKNDVLNMHKLFNELQNENYKPGLTNNFKINERGKRRDIYSYELRDRIVFKCFCDNYLNPLFSKSLIYDCPASVKQKGILFAKNRIKEMIYKYFNKYKTNKGFVLKLDISSYFANIDHRKLLEMVKTKIFDKKVYKLFELIIKDNDNNASKNTKGVGLGLGSQLSQICALIYLNKLDHYIKEKLHIKFYERYMDDICVISNNKKETQNCLKQIIKILHSLGLHINQKATRIYKLENSFKFLKMKICLTKSGKIYIHNITKTFSKLGHKIKYLLKNNKVKEVEKIIPSWSTYILYGDDYKKFMSFLKKQKLYYNFKSKNIEWYNPKRQIVKLLDFHNYYEYFLKNHK